MTRRRDGGRGATGARLQQRVEVARRALVDEPHEPAGRAGSQRRRASKLGRPARADVPTKTAAAACALTSRDFRDVVHVALPRRERRGEARGQHDELCYTPGHSMVTTRCLLRHPTAAAAAAAQGSRTVAPRRRVAPRSERDLRCVMGTSLNRMGCCACRLRSEEEQPGCCLYLGITCSACFCTRCTGAWAREARAAMRGVCVSAQPGRLNGRRD